MIGSQCFFNRIVRKWLFLITLSQMKLIIKLIKYTVVMKILEFLRVGLVSSRLAFMYKFCISSRFVSRSLKGMLCLYSNYFVSTFKIELIIGSIAWFKSLLVRILTFYAKIPYFKNFCLDHIVSSRLASKIILKIGLTRRNEIWGETSSRFHD